MENDKSRSLNIVVVEPRGTGGMIHYAYQMCTAFSRCGSQVTLITSSVYEMDGFPHNFTLNKLLRLWSTIEPQQTDSNWGWTGRVAQKIFRGARRAVRGIRLIIEWCRLVIFLIRTKPDIIQFGKIEFPFEAIFLKFLQRRGLVLAQICHEFELREQGNSLMVGLSNKLFLWVYDAFSFIFFHGESNRKRFLSLFDLPKERLHIIEHGNEGLFLSERHKGMTVAQTREHYGIKPDAPVILFFGNLMPSKGIPDLMKAFAFVHQKEEQARLLIAGNPSKFVEIDKLKNLAFELKLSEAIIFDTRYIPMKDVAGLMEMSSVVVYPYLNSTQSGALQVAYTFGRAVIATDVGGLPEAVEKDRSGFLIPPNAPDELARTIMKFIENPKLVEEMGNYARQLSETRFSWENIAGRILKVYSSQLQ